MPKGGFVGQGFCGFLLHIYANVVIVQQHICHAVFATASLKHLLPCTLTCHPELDSGFHCYTRLRLKAAMTEKTCSEKKHVMTKKTVMLNLNLSS